MRQVHTLKIGPLFFDAVTSGDKKAGFRKNDRDFRCGDFLRLRKWDGEYTGHELLVKITHILPVEELIPGAGNWAMLSFQPLETFDETFNFMSEAGGDL